MTRAAPPYFPYHHRTLAGRTDKLMLAQYEACQTAYNNGNKRWRSAKNATATPTHDYGEFQPNRYGKQGGNAIETKAGQNTVGAVPDPDQNRLSRSR